MHAALTTCQARCLMVRCGVAVSGRVQEKSSVHLVRFEQVIELLEAA